MYVKIFEKETPHTLVKHFSKHGALDSDDGKLLPDPRDGDPVLDLDLNIEEEHSAGTLKLYSLPRNIDGQPPQRFILKYRLW